jgi:hypothetical protein
MEVCRKEPRGPAGTKKKQSRYSKGAKGERMGGAKCSENPKHRQNEEFRANH